MPQGSHNRISDSIRHKIFFLMHRAQMEGRKPNFRQIAKDCGVSYSSVMVITGPYHLPRP